MIAKSPAVRVSTATLNPKWWFQIWDPLVVEYLIGKGPTNSYGTVCRPIRGMEAVCCSHYSFWSWSWKTAPIDKSDIWNFRRPRDQYTSPNNEILELSASPPPYPPHQQQSPPPPKKKKNKKKTHKKTQHPSNQTGEVSSNEAAENGLTV